MPAELDLGPQRDAPRSHRAILPGRPNQHGLNLRHHPVQTRNETARSRMKRGAQMTAITTLNLKNFKKFSKLTLKFDAGLNILVGDNEAGKSSALQALDLVLSGSRSKAESVGLENLLNRAAVDAFLAGERKFTDLPVLQVEVFLTAGMRPELNGVNNSMGKEFDGLLFEYAPVDAYSKDITEALRAAPNTFPYEYYAARFATFAGDPFSGVKRYLRHLVIDSSRIDNDYAAREYTRSVFAVHADVANRSRLEHLYRQSKNAFTDEHLSALNKGIEDYQFDVRTGSKTNLETDLVITEDDIPIESKGKGRQCFIKTEFALGKHAGHANLDVLLLEEPENHLSHTTMRALVDRIAESAKKQLFVATHSSLISSRLDLRRVQILGTEGCSASLASLSDETARFFMKAPDNNILEFALSTRVILVEGDAEFILLDALYTKHSGGRTLEQDRVHVISVGGTSFKRYLELGKLIGVRTAVLRDNDKDFTGNCVDNYAAHLYPQAKVFADPDNQRSTFEICLYQDNSKICDALFGPGRLKLTPQEYMLANKADAAFALLEKAGNDLVAPAYMQEAIAWVRA